MQSDAKTPDEYVQQLPEKQQQPIQKLREVIKTNLQEGFEETMQYGMIGYVVPHSIYPDGYYVKPEEPLPFISLAAQKKHLALYHMGIYTTDSLMDWFVDEYKKRMGTEPDLGKSCIRFKKIDDIPYDLIGELCTKMNVNEWISIYEEKVKRG